MFMVSSRISFQKFVTFLTVAINCPGTKSKLGPYYKRSTTLSAFFDGNDVKKSKHTQQTNVDKFLTRFFLNLKDECSFVSLRDVERAMQVMVWFYKHVDTLGRLMKKVIIKQRREEGEDVEDDDDEDEEVTMVSGI